MHAPDGTKGDDMANLSIRKPDDDTVQRLRIRAAHHRHVGLKADGAYIW
jgi:hypothetical protein